MTFSNSSLIYIPIGIGDNNNTIIIKDDGTINIDGGIVIIPVRTDEELHYLFQKIEKDGSYKYTIIKGKYNGSFDDVILEMSSDLENNRCETIETNFQEDYNELSIIFSFDKSKCGIKWWVILLICLGILVVLVTIFIILITVNKTFRKKILPFRNRAKSASHEKDLEDKRNNALYKGKTRINPTYE